MGAEGIGKVLNPIGAVAPETVLDPVGLAASKTSGTTRQLLDPAGAMRENGFEEPAEAKVKQYKHEGLRKPTGPSRVVNYNITGDKDG